jgi:hypothetical protein
MFIIATARIKLEKQNKKLIVVLFFFLAIKKLFKRAFE